MGLETEYGILGAEPEDVVAACLEAEGQAGRSRGVRWDYSGEYPLRDARGFEVDHSAADPSMLTDIPGAASVEGPVPGRLRTTIVERLTAQEEAWQRGTATCVGTGGRALPGPPAGRGTSGAGLRHRLRSRYRHHHSVRSSPTPPTCRDPK